MVHFSKSANFKIRLSTVTNLKDCGIPLLGGGGGAVLAALMVKCLNSHQNLKFKNLFR